ncbi:hypothetical protein NMY22_g14127 [Coprinellus aureogranulatus]|nr:hypothetical protein NMY22_g14127 [Coprinellus aureogranulatus]
MSTVAVCDQLLIATLALDPNGIVNKGDSNFNDLTNAIVSDLDSYRHFLRYRGKEALVLIDALQQALLPNVALSQTERANFLNALLRLSKRSVLLPSSFSLTGIENVRRIYRLETWCTDIFEGIHGGRKVFLKRYRLCNDSWTKEERDELLNREAILWANHQHSGVLPFLGVFKREDAYDPGLYLVSPFMEQGTIVEYSPKQTLPVREGCWLANILVKPWRISTSADRRLTALPALFVLPLIPQDYLEQYL